MSPAVAGDSWTFSQSAGTGPCGYSTISTRHYGEFATRIDPTLLAGDIYAGRRPPSEVACSAAPLTTLNTGDLVTDGTVSVEVPEPGYSLYASLDGQVGSNQLLVRFRRGGKVEVEFCGAADETADSAAEPPEDPSGEPGSQENLSPESPDACADDRHRPLARWYGGVTWYYNKSTTPNYLSANDAEASMIEAADSIVTAHNSCGRPDSVPASYVYGGATGLRADVKQDGTSTTNICQANRDGVNVVDWGDFAGGQLGYACVKTAGDGIAEADIRLNKNDHVWAINPNSCDLPEWIVRAVATHEFGHFYGLGHVNEERHGNLTMSEDLDRWCQQPEYTLGLGDTLALESLY